jgi:hypothetical protein
MTQQEKWGLNHRMVAKQIVVAVHNQPNELDAIHEVMDALDYVWNQGWVKGTFGYDPEKVVKKT